MLSMRVGAFPVTQVLVEERLAIASEFFVSLAIDDHARAPVLLFACGGGSGIESRAAAMHRIACDVMDGPDASAMEMAVASLGLDATRAEGLKAMLRRVFEIAKGCDARSLEINPLVFTADGRLVAADCRLTIDDYAVARRPELGIEIARELDHPPTSLERVAYRVEQADHRGTFYFAQMSPRLREGSRGLVGFHGAGGGGSMMSMDAVTAAGFDVANFCDTSGNPSPAKVYRAARIILSQPGLVGYFGSGSGVANQEQYWSAYGLAKAFWELELDIPAVVRLGGNTEDQAVEILEQSCKAASLPATVEAYRKNDSPAAIASRFATLVQASGGRSWRVRKPRGPSWIDRPGVVEFPLSQGRVLIESVHFARHSKAIIARSSGLLRCEQGIPVLAVSPETFASKDSEMIACEVECRRDGIDGLFVELEIAGLDAAAGLDGERGSV